jgi:hypothetical protein
MVALQAELEFPPYFGFNWNARSDCLEDLNWIQSKRVVRVHEALPKLSSQELRMYLEILADAVQSWIPDEQHDFIVAFPPSCRDRVLSLAK